MHRAIALLAVLGATPALAASPPLCALPQPAATPVAAPAASPSPHPDGGPVVADPPRAASPLPASLASVPFIQHIASAGAAITDFGMAHGLRSVAARSATQFMVFEISPDGQAAVSGAMTDLSPAQLATLAAGNITDLGIEHGLHGMFVRSGAQFQVFYATPEGARVIPGVMWDRTGKDLTRAQVAHIPGAVPTVTVGDAASGGAAPEGGSAPSVASADVLPLVRKAFSGTVGSASAPHLWMLIDPQCVYSVRAYQMLQPYVQNGRLQLSVIPLSVLDYEDHGQSTRSALALLSKPSDQIVQSWQAGDVNNPPSPDADSRLQANRAIQQAIGLRGTPTLIWRKADGTEGRLDGIPTDVGALIASIAS